MRSAQSLAVILSVASFAIGCKGASAVTGSIAALGTDAIVDKQPSASVGLDVARDGHVQAAVEAPDGKPLTKSATGSVVFKTTSGATQTVALAPDAKTGLLVGAGPKLDGLTEIDYTLAADGKPLSGTVYVPATGTAALSAAAKTTAQAASQPDAHGPHGGVVQIVGNERLEIAATPGGEVRVYVLDAELHPVAVGARRIVLGVQADRPELVVLAPDPTGRFFTGHWNVHADPVRITVHEEVGTEVHVVVIGAGFGGAIVVGPGAPHVKVVVVERWDDDVDVDVHVAGRGRPGWHGEGHDDDGEGHGGVRVQINGPHGRVKIK